MCAKIQLPGVIGTSPTPAGIADGKGSWRDNVFVEQLWRSVKYEEVYLHAYESVSAVKAGLNKYFDFYNHRRPHSKLDRMTPAKQYDNALPVPMAA